MQGKSRIFWLMSLFSLALLLPGQVKAQDETSESAFSISGGVATTTHYFYNGWNQEDQGFILQADLGLNVDMSDVAPGLSLDFAIWNSFHEHKTGASPGSGNDQWYEADLSFGLNYEIPETEGLTLSGHYAALTSPNGAFSTVHELQLGASHPAYGLNPYLMLGIELQNSSSLFASDPSEGTYVKLGIEPKFDLPISEELPVRLVVPVSTAFGFGNYFEGTRSSSQFGYISFGAVGELDLDAFIIERYGKWTTYIGYEWLILGDGPRLANKGDRNEFILSFGIRLQE